jgi:hypothetical protein
MTMNCDAIRHELGLAMLSEMLRDVPSLPHAWHDHVVKIAIRPLLDSTEGFNISAAGAAAQRELHVLSGLGGGPVYDENTLNLIFGQYANEPADTVSAAKDDFAASTAPVRSVRDQFLETIAADLLDAELAGLAVAEGTAGRLLPQVLEALKGGDELDPESAKMMIRKSLAQQGCGLDHSAAA